MYEYFEHTADIGVRAFGINLAAAFEEAAKGMFNIMVDIDTVNERQEIEINVEADNKENLLIEWLNALIAEADCKEMAFANFQIQDLRNVGTGYYLKGLAIGESLDKERHNIKIEVKAATYSQLKVEFRRDKVMVQCVVDV